MLLASYTDFEHEWSVTRFETIEPGDMRRAHELENELDVKFYQADQISPVELLTAMMKGRSPEERLAAMVIKKHCKPVPHKVHCCCVRGCPAGEVLEVKRGQASLWICAGHYESFGFVPDSPQEPDPVAGGPSVLARAGGVDEAYAEGYQVGLRDGHDSYHSPDGQQSVDPSSAPAESTPDSA